MFAAKTITRSSRNRFSSACVLATFALAFAPVTGRADPPGDVNNWRVVYADEFSGTSIDTVKWATQYQWGPTHNHTAYMQANRVSVADGEMTLTATRESAPSGKAFTSGMISSHDTFRLTYGYLEARINMPTRRGSWPAFWMLSDGWPPEIDIMEYPLFTDTTTVDQYAVNSFWSDGNGGTPSNYLMYDTNNQTLGSGFHTYGLDWNSSQLRYYFDGNLIKTSSNQSQFQNMYMMLNYAVGGWPVPGSTDANPLPPPTSLWTSGASDTTDVEWVRIWKTAPASATSTWTYTAATNGSWDTSGNWSGGVPNYERQSVVLPTLAGRAAMEIRWGDSRTVGSMTLNGNTAYTLGQPGSPVESIMFADLTDNTTEINVISGTGGHVFNSRLDLWSNVSARNDAAGAVTFNGDIIGEARLVSNRWTGGQLILRGTGSFNLNGNGYYQRSTIITEGVTARLNGQLYVDANVVDETVVQVDLGSTLLAANLDTALGGLPTDPERFFINGGTIGVTASSNLTRGFKIGSGDATFDVGAGLALRLAVHPTNPAATIVSSAGGNLVMTGAGIGRLQKPLGGNGGVVKDGTGSWFITSTNSYSGQTIVQSGPLTVDGTTGTGDTVVQAAGQLKGNGQVLGNLTVDGHVGPGASAGTLSVEGNYVQNAGSTLDIELGGTTPGLFDVLNVTGTATLNGNLNISFINSFTPAPGNLFPILNAADVFGTLALTGQSAGFWLLPTTTGMSLYFGDLPPGDYDRNGVVAAADYDIWTAAFGSDTDLAADGSNDGTVDTADYVIWRHNFGATVFPAGTGSATNRPAANVPEPTTLLLACSAALAYFAFCRRCP